MVALTDETADFERHELIERAFAKLSPPQRRVVVLALLEGLTYREIAGHLAIPFGTVKSRLLSALAKLRENEEAP